MSDIARQYALDLADATYALRLHLEEKQRALQEENVAKLNNVLLSEHSLTQRVKKLTQMLDAELRRKRVTSLKGGLGQWLNLQLAECSANEQERLTRLAEDTIACQEMQVRQQEMMLHSLIYYQSMTRFLSGVQQFTYEPHKP